MYIDWLLCYPITGFVLLTTSGKEEYRLYRCCMAIVQCCTNHVRGLMRYHTELKGCCLLGIVQHGIMSEAYLVR